MAPRRTQRSGLRVARIRLTRQTPMSPPLEFEANGPGVVSSGGCNTSGIVEVVLSSRRVKKGPGHRPLSAKPQKVMELRERGWSIRATANEVGISRSSGNNWASGYKTYRKGQWSGSCRRWTV